MTEPTDKPLDDRQLDEYLKGDSSVSRQYRQLPGAEVPASLDRLVLRQAQDAVKRPTRPAWMRWTAPLAVAASAVLVVSIVIETGLKEQTLVSAPTAQRSIEREAIKEQADAAPPAQVAAPPPAVAEVPAPAPQSLARDRSSAAPIAPTFAPERKELSADEAAGAVPQKQVAKAAAQRENDALIANAERQKKVLEEAAREQELSASQRAARNKQVEAPEPKAVLSYSRPISATADNTATIERNYTDPEAWLKDIRQLRKDNKQDQADREWHRFRASFPNYEVAETDAAREPKK
jgi:hypothetical protein